MGSVEGGEAEPNLIWQMCKKTRRAMAHGNLAEMGVPSNVEMEGISGDKSLSSQGPADRAPGAMIMTH